MSNNEIPPHVQEQARTAASGMQDSINAPTNAPPVSQPTPSLSTDASATPEPYDVQGQEAFRADKREAIAAENAPGANAPAADTPSTEEYQPLSSMSDEEMDKALNAAAGAQIQSDYQSMQTDNTPQADQEYGQPETTDPAPAPAPEQEAPAVEME